MRIVFSTGDINGIGLETLYTALSTHTYTEFEFILSANTDATLEYFDKMKYSYNLVQNSIYINNNKLNITELNFRPHINFGVPTEDSGKYAIESLEAATQLLLKNEADAIVTLPIAKEACKFAGWKFPGHTEYFANIHNSNYMMVLTDLKIYVALATIHIPIKEIPYHINSENIINKIKMLFNTLKKDIEITHPRIAVLGLNPHAGENGVIGMEEQEHITPAITELQNLGINVSGPFPADGFFASKSYENFDGILAMYHDQGLIPLKMLAFPGGVNYTAGLNFIRTSPDHGTAFAIAGQNKANPQSLIDSIELAEKIHSNRKNSVL